MDKKKWIQLEFDFSTPVVKEKSKPKKMLIDYEAIFKELQKGPLTFSQIWTLSGVKRAGVSQVITTLSLRYPIYEEARGVYKLLD